MHEGSIIKSLFDIAKVSRSEANLVKVHKVKVVVGKFHHIVNEFMQMYFNIMKEEVEGFENALLEIEEREPLVSCTKCGETIELKEAVFICPKCNSTQTEVIQGNELYLDSIEGECKDRV